MRFESAVEVIHLPVAGDYGRILDHVWEFNLWIFH